MSESFGIDVNMLVRVLNYLNAGVYVTDKERRIMLWNRKAEEITGYRAEEIVGSACHDDVLNHITKDGVQLCPGELCPLHRSIETGVASGEPVLVYARKRDGKRVAVSVSVAPLHDDSGNIIGGIEIFHDETSTVADLEFAKNIQQKLLPQSLPDVKNVDFDVRYYPRELVGGDFYDIRELGGGRYGIMVADVRGHGVSAALYTMWLKSLEESNIELAGEPSEFMTALNRELSRFVVSRSFATVFYGVLDVETCQMRYSNAGHPPPLYFHVQDGRGMPTESEVHGPPVGIVADQKYAASTLSLEPGNLLLCYTDGVTEVYDKDGQMLGSEGVGRLVVSEMSETSSNLLDRLHKRVMERCDSVCLSDDVLLLSVKRT
ncbi:MAG: PP2C family protein-serine/threonine phosphatase [Planctomycetota bacterium]|jgi:PAS domain S-box-containing protein